MEQHDYAELRSLYAHWRSDGISSIQPIEDFAKLLLQGAFGELNDDQRRALDVIHRASMRATECWNFPAAYLMVRQNHRAQAVRAVALSDVLSCVQIELTQRSRIDDIHISMPDALPQVAGNDQLDGVLIDLLDPEPFATWQPAVRPALEARLDLHGDVHITVRSALQLHADQHPEYNVQREQLYARLFYPGSRLALAEMLLEQLGSRLQVCLRDGVLAFEFTLTTWKA